MRLRTHQRDFFNNGSWPLLGHLARRARAHIIHRFIHLGDDVKTVQDVHCLRTFLADHPEVRLPHVRAGECDLGAQFRPDHGEEALEDCHCPHLSYPQQAGEPGIDLRDQREVLVPFGILDFIHTNGAKGANVRCSRPQLTTYFTGWQTLSQVVRNDCAVSSHESLRAQFDRNYMYTLVRWWPRALAPRRCRRFCN